MAELEKDPFFRRPFWIFFFRFFYFFFLHLLKKRYHFFRYYWWFLQNLRKDFIRTNMHTTVWPFLRIDTELRICMIIQKILCLAIFFWLEETIMFKTKVTIPPEMCSKFCKRLFEQLGLFRYTMLRRHILHILYCWAVGCKCQLSFSVI